MQWVLNLDIIDKSFVDVVQELLSFKGRILFDPPDVLHLVEIAVVALDLDFTCCQIWNCLEVVLVKDLLYILFG